MLENVNASNECGGHASRYPAASAQASVSLQDGKDSISPGGSQPSQSRQAYGLVRFGCVPQHRAIRRIRHSPNRGGSEATSERLNAIRKAAGRMAMLSSGPS